jgi:hypothetical protein
LHCPFRRTGRPLHRPWMPLPVRKSSI